MMVDDPQKAEEAFSVSVGQISKFDLVAGAPKGRSPRGRRSRVASPPCSKHCHKYNACNRPVYFVKSQEYDDDYRPGDSKGKGKGHAKRAQGLTGVPPSDPRLPYRPISTLAPTARVRAALMPEIIHEIGGRFVWGTPNLDEARTNGPRLFCSAQNQTPPGRSNRDYYNQLPPAPPALP